MVLASVASALFLLITILGGFILAKGICISPLPFLALGVVSLQSAIPTSHPIESATVFEASRLQCERTSLRIPNS